jgi:hypothetical protein
VNVIGAPTEMAMSNSKPIAAIVGPTMIAMLVSEFPLVQPHLYDAQIPPAGCQKAFRLTATMKAD